jgi:hypothetical protein
MGNEMDWSRILEIAKLGGVVGGILLALYFGDLRARLIAENQALRTEVDTLKAELHKLKVQTELRRIMAEGGIGITPPTPKPDIVPAVHTRTRIRLDPSSITLEDLLPSRSSTN